MASAKEEADLMSGKRREKKRAKSRCTHIDLHAPVQAVVEQKVVRHADPVRFHGVALAVVVVSDIAFKKKTMRGFDERNYEVTAGTRQMSHQQPLPVHLAAPKRKPRCGT